MERCQHIPVLHRKQEQGQPEQIKVTCRRCALGTEWAVCSVVQAWDGWARLMVKESEANEKAAAAYVDPKTARDADQAALWRAFCAAAKMEPKVLPAASNMGENARIHAKIVGALREHLTGQLNERRIYDLFVPLRKAMRAFAMNATPEPAAEPARSPMSVAFTGKGGYDMDVEFAIKRGLCVGQAYVVTAGLIHRNTTRLLLYGITGDFNSAMFDDVDMSHPCMHWMEK